MTRNDEVPQEVGEALRDRLLMEAVQWDDWNRDHPGDQALTTPPLLRDAADAITTLRAKLEAAEGEVARLREDARRYQFLRRPEAWRADYLSVAGGISAIFVSDGRVGHATDGAELDAAIDAATDGTLPAPADHR